MNRLCCRAARLLTLTIAFCVIAQGVVAQAPTREVNLTANSAPGWLPSEQLEKTARKTLLDFLSALDQAHYATAYKLLADLNRRETPEAFGARPPHSMRKPDRYYRDKSQRSPGPKIPLRLQRREYMRRSIS